MSIPITCSEKWHYRMQNQIFSKLYTDTAKTEWIRGPALIAFSKSISISTIALTASVGELIIKGLSILCSENREHGWILLRRVPWQILKLTAGSLTVLTISTFMITFDPEFYILLRAEHSKVSFDHAEAGTMDSQAYERESNYATGRAKTGREEWKNSQRIVP